MKTESKLALLSIGALAVLAAQSAYAGGSKPIKLEAVPAPAAAAIEKWAGKGKLTSLVVEKHGTATVYEAAVESPGTSSRGVSVNADGQIVGTEEEIAAADAPEVIRTAAAGIVGAGKITKVERITEGEVTTYEIEFERDGKASEVELTAEGKKVEKKKADKGENDDDEDDDDDEDEDEDEDDDDDDDDDDKDEQKK